MIKKNDIIMIGVILLLSLGAILFMLLTRKEGNTVVVTLEGSIYDTLELKEDTIYRVEGSNGAYNVFEVKDGYVDMIDASCPDKVCVKHKKIRYNHDSITCLPNNVILEIKSEEEDDIDIIAH